MVEVMVPESATESFDDYVRRRSVPLQRFAYLVTHNAEDARDCVQDALIGLYPRWETVAASGAVDAYVNRSIINASVSRWRKTSRTFPVADLDAGWTGAIPDPSGAVDDADEAWRLVQGLPTLQRAAVVLRFYSDLPFSDVADALGCTESTARSHVFRALTVLRTRLIGGDDD